MPYAHYGICAHVHMSGSRLIVSFDSAWKRRSDPGVLLSLPLPPIWLSLPVAIIVITNYYDCYGHPILAELAVLRARRHSTALRKEDIVTFITSMGLISFFRVGTMWLHLFLAVSLWALLTLRFYFFLFDTNKNRIQKYYI